MYFRQFNQNFKKDIFPEKIGLGFVWKKINITFAPAFEKQRHLYKG